MSYLLGIDLGSTSLKAVVYDLDSRLIASGSHPTKRFHPYPDHPDWTVWDPEQIFSGTAAAIREALSGVGDPRQIKGLAVTGMGMDGLPIDDKGQWLYPFISWHDPRTAPQLEWWKKHVGVERTFSIGGNPVWAINSALRIRWMMENEPRIIAQADKWLLIEDYLNFRLCGRRATDYSMASCTMLFDQRRRQWSEELLAAAEIDPQILPEILPSGTPLGEVTAEAAQATGLATGTPVILGGHDHLCAALPTGAFRPGVILDTTGTWEIVLAVTPQPALDPRLAVMGMTVQAHVARGMYTIWGANVAGEMLEWFRKQFGYHARHLAAATGRGEWEILMESATASPPGARGMLFLPHMSGVGCPIVDPRSRGAFVGLTERTTADDLLRAIIEGLNYQLRDIVCTMETALGGSASRFDKLIAAGGATRNPFWMQNKADVLGRPVEAPEIEEATSLGAAILAGIGLGLYRDEEEAFQRVRGPGKVYLPDPQRTQLYSNLFELYRQLYPALAPLHHRLSQNG
jgi:xylulokinase